MIRGYVSETGVPEVQLPVAGRTWTAVVDTGFNSDLELPVALRPFVNPHLMCQIRSSLAGGQVIREDGYAVDFPFDGQTVRALATFVPGKEILLGTRLLRLERAADLRQGASDAH
jgi:predicted aspartyl protease